MKMISVKTDGKTYQFIILEEYIIYFFFLYIVST